MCAIFFSAIFCIRKSCQKRGHCQSTKSRKPKNDKNGKGLRERAVKKRTGKKRASKDVSNETWHR